MKKIIVVTDFSEASINALNYACKFATDHGMDILLAHIYTIPASYAGEGLSMVAIHDTIEANRKHLKQELDNIKSENGHLNIEAGMIIGNFVASLLELKNSQDASLIIIGSEKGYSELWQWSNDWLEALTVISCPVLVIPQHIAYSPIMRIAYASDNTKAGLSEQAETIKKLALLSKANFYIVHVTPFAEPEDDFTEVYNELFGDIAPQYYTVENRSVVKGIAEFVEQFFIDLLIVVPRKHGLWHSLRNKSYTKQLALLNHIPVMALHESN